MYIKLKKTDFKFFLWNLKKIFSIYFDGGREKENDKKILG